MNKAQRQMAHHCVAMTLVALILMMGMAGANPDLHRALHADSNCLSACEHSEDSQPDESAHSCGVTMLQIGAVFHMEPPALERLGKALEAIETCDESFCCATSISLPQGRAPPIAGIV